MDRLVAVYRHNRSGDFIAHPFGTFLGLGAFASLKVYRSVPANEPAPALGVMVVELLKLSGPTGANIRDVEQYDRLHPPDGESDRVMRHYHLPRRSVLDLHRKFTLVNVELQHGYKSWHVCPKVYDWSQRGVLRHDPKREVRVRVSLGPVELDTVLRQLLDPVPKPKRAIRTGPPNNALQRTRFARR